MVGGTVLIWLVCWWVGGSVVSRTVLIWSVDWFSVVGRLVDDLLVGQWLVVGRLLEHLLVCQWSIASSPWVSGGPVGGSVIGGLSVVGAFIICREWSDTSLSTNVSTKNVNILSIKETVDVTLVCLVIKEMQPSAKIRL